MYIHVYYDNCDNGYGYHDIEIFIIVQAYTTAVRQEIKVSFGSHLPSLCWMCGSAMVASHGLAHLRKETVLI